MKTVFITGCSTGIGRAAAAYFDKEGWNVAATMRNPAKASFPNASDRLKVFACDVIDRNSVQKAVKDTIEAFGSIDVCVNNAGFSLIGPFETTEPSEIDKQYQTNVFGLMNVIREVLPIMREHKNGTIINIASIGGRVGFPLYSLYNSTKFAVEGFSESLSHELRKFNIRVKIVEPGVIKTDFYGRSMVHQDAENITPYEPYASKTMSRLASFGEKGIRPEAVAKVIFRAARSKSGRMRYKAGNDAVLLATLRGLLPFGIFQWLLRSNTE